MIKWALSLWYKDSSVYANQSMLYTILTNWEIKNNHLEKAIPQNSTLIYNKNSRESRHRRNIPQHIKGHILQTHSKHYFQWCKNESIPPKIRNKIRVSTFITITQQSSGSPSYSNQRRKINKRNPDWREEIKVLITCRWHETVHRKP